MTQLDYTNSIPLHFQLKKAIQEKIYSGEYVEKIPSEKELMDEFYVSRSTVRQSITNLVQEGVLEKRRGKGTYVALKPINDWLGNLNSTSETIERMGMTPGAKLIDAKVVQLDSYIKEISGLEEAYLFKRIRYADHTPIGIESNYYPIEIGKKFLKYDLNKEAFYHLLEMELGVQTFEADQVIKSSQITKEDASLLGISPRTNVLNTERRITGKAGAFIEFENAIYRSDMYSFNIRLSRSAH